VKLRLTSSLLSALRRPISGGIVSKRLTLNCTATRQQRGESATATHVQERQLRHGKRARRDLGEGVAVELVEAASPQRHEKRQEAHPEIGHARQLCDVVGHGDELSITQLRRTGDA